MASQGQKIHGIIHLAAAGCASVGAGLAQAPGSDASLIVPMQTAMISAIAAEHGVSLTKAAAADLLLTFAATTGGRLLSQVLVGWVPGIGNLVNASTAAAITEAISRAAHRYFEKNEGAGR